jgi:hypothetical protein
MAKVQMKPDKNLYGRLRKSGVRKKVATRVSEALPRKGAKKPSRAERVADELSAAAESIRKRAGGGSRKRSNAAKKGARTRKAKVAKRRSAGRKAAKARAKN